MKDENIALIKLLVEQASYRAGITARFLEVKHEDWKDDLAFSITYPIAKDGKVASWRIWLENGVNAPDLYDINAIQSTIEGLMK